jgi:hypothetical protein
MNGRSTSTMVTTLTIVINGSPLSNYLTGLSMKELSQELKRTKRERPVAFLLVGPPAAGKTTVGKQLVSQIPNSALVDDPGPNCDIVGLCSLQHVTIITDPRLVREEVRAQAELKLSEHGIKYGWLYFEKNFDKCLANLKRRETADYNKIISVWELKHFIDKYTIPKGVVPVPIWSENNNGR